MFFFSNEMPIKKIIGELRNIKIFLFAYLSFAQQRNEYLKWFLCMYNEEKGNKSKTRKSDENEIIFNQIESNKSCIIHISYLFVLHNFKQLLNTNNNSPLPLKSDVKTKKY